MNAMETHEAARDGIAAAGRSPACCEREIAALRREVASLRAALEGAAHREARLSSELDALLRPPSHAVVRPGGRFDLFDSGREAGLFERAMRADGYIAETVAVVEWTRHPGPAAGPSRGALRALALREPPRFGQGTSP